MTNKEFFKKLLAMLDGRYASLITPDFINEKKAGSIDEVRRIVPSVTVRKENSILSVSVSFPVGVCGPVAPAGRLLIQEIGSADLGGLIDDILNLSEEIIAGYQESAKVRDFTQLIMMIDMPEGSPVTNIRCVSRQWWDTRMINQMQDPEKIDLTAWRQVNNRETGQKYMVKACESGKEFDEFLDGKYGIETDRWTWCPGVHNNACLKFLQDEGYETHHCVMHSR